MTKLPEDIANFILAVNYAPIVGSDIYTDEEATPEYEHETFLHLQEEAQILANKYEI